VVFSILLAAALILTFARRQGANQALSIIDFLLFLLAGLSGCIMLFMWFATDHLLCRDNYNLLWALPSHLGLALYVHSNKPWVKKYFTGATILYTLLLLGWFFMPQNLNDALLPLVALLAFRSAALAQLFTYAKNKRV
jgi:drug/metabolite transporter (DMT)-like permease